MHEASFCSNDSSEYELNSDTLDQLYKEHLHMLRELVFKQSRIEDIELCRKWLKIFSKTSKAEKMARNCLCSLMQQQLQEDGTLSEPFTNLQNCNRDLERVLEELDERSYVVANNWQMQPQTTAHKQNTNRCCRQNLQQHQHYSTSKSREEAGSLYGYENIAMCSGGGGCGDNAELIYTIQHHKNYKCRDKTNAQHDDRYESERTRTTTDNRAGGDDGCLEELSTECEENEKLTENLLLRRELEALRLQLTEKEIENVHLKEISEKYQMENANQENVLDSIRKNLLAAIKTAIQQWRETAKQQTLLSSRPTQRLFEMIFKDFETNLEFAKTIKQYDIEFEQILAKYFENEFSKRKLTQHVTRKYLKSKKRLQEKYESRLRIQNWTQRLQLKLVKLKCFSALRKIFINAQLTLDGGGGGGGGGGSELDAKMWQILRMLEEKYEYIVNELV